MFGCDGRKVFYDNQTVFYEIPNSLPRKTKRYSIEDQKVFYGRSKGLLRTTKACERQASFLWKDQKVFSERPNDLMVLYGSPKSLPKDLLQQNKRVFYRPRKGSLQKSLRSAMYFL